MWGHALQCLHTKKDLKGTSHANSDTQNAGGQELSGSIKKRGKNRSGNASKRRGLKVNGRGDQGNARTK